MATLKTQRRFRIRKGIRKKVSGTPERPRLSVFKSNRAVYAQLIDDVNGLTLVSYSSKHLGKEGNATVEVATEVGKKLAELAKGKKIENVVFDRGGYLYHGRIKALAEGAREGGLKF